MRVPVGGGEKAALFSQGNFGWLQLAVDDTHVYWTADSDDSGTTGTVVEMPLDGGPATILVSDAKSPFGITVYDDAIYWTDIGAGTLMRLRK